MGSRSRKRRREGAPPRVRGEARNEQIRAELEPLAPGERPRAVTVAAIVAAVLAVVNVAAAPLVEHRTGRDWVFVVIQGAVLALAAVGMWRGRYWAVMGFEALLGIACVISGIQLLFAPTVRVAVIAVVVLALAGPLFWFLIRAMARIQMPERPASVRRHG